MKASRIVLYSGAGFLALLILVSLILVKVSITRDIGHPTGEEVIYSGESAEIDIDTTGVKAIRITGGWKTGLKQGSSGRGVITVPVEAEKNLTIEHRGSELHIAMRKDFNPGPSSPYRIELELESLVSIGVEGATDIKIRDFSGDNLEIRLAGASTVSGINVSMENLTVRAAGASNLDLRDSLVVNADLVLEGASNAELQMAGGRLTGRLSGVGSVEYGGSVSEESIRTEGIASVRRR